MITKNKIILFLNFCIMVSFARCTAKCNHTVVPGYGDGLNMYIYDQPTTTSEKKAEICAMIQAREKYRDSGYFTEENAHAVSFDSITGYHEVWVHVPRYGVHCMYVKIKTPGSAWVFDENIHEGVINHLLYWPYYKL